MSIQERDNGIRFALKILLPIACLLWLAFILTNSLRSAEGSSEQSVAMVEVVQEVAKVIAPESAIANATGEAYDQLHSSIRACAHFVEFAVLGALFCWCYFVYTLDWKRVYWPTVGTLLVPILDEGLQLFSEGRAWQLTDILLDSFGGVAGIAFAVLCIAVGKRIYERVALRKNN